MLQIAVEQVEHYLSQLSKHQAEEAHKRATVASADVSGVHSATASAVDTVATDAASHGNKNTGSDIPVAPPPPLIDTIGKWRLIDVIG